jgi:hypothetical protein
MAAFKQFLASDVIVTPLEVNKGFTYLYSEFTDSDVQINQLWGRNVDYLTNPSLTGNVSIGQEAKALVYNSIKELYYSNFISSSTGDSVATASLVPGEDEAGNVLEGPSSSRGRYENYLQTSLSQSRFIPTGSGEGIAVFSIPSRLYGDYIQPESFIWEDNTNNVTFTDDGLGNIITGSEVVGNIIYQHGLAVITDQDINGLSPEDFTTATNVTCSFSSSYSIYETQYKATIRESEYNFSQNPTIISGSTEGTVYDFTTGSFFQPYVTTVGLYDEQQNLLAVGKLSQPYPLSRTTDTSIFINLDR